MKNILVSGVGGDIGQGVIHCLSKSLLPLNIYKVGSSRADAGLHFDERSFIIPPINDETYLDFLVDFLNRYKIDLYIPGVDGEIIFLSRSLANINLHHQSKILVDPLSAVEIADDKFITAEFLKKNNLPHPVSSSIKNHDDLNRFISRINGSFFLKSRSGCGSKGLQLLDNPSDVESFIGNPKYMIQENIQGEEYTAGLYKGNDNEIKGCVILKRELKNGATINAERILDSSIESQLRKITLLLGLRYTNIQFKIRDGNVFPFEINSRFSGTTGIISSVFNGPEMAIRELLFNEKISPVVNCDKFHAMRYMTEVLCSDKDMKSLVGRKNL